ncbi:MAG: GatB/YqeY domain-containing protein [Phaeodactylibacter sp.]|nr:GatB/YqeY domain-containing protein [Phaeodactylibacter sp.]
MSALKQRIEADLKKAMLAKDEDRKRALRNLKSAIMVEQTRGSKDKEPGDADIIKIIRKAAKQRQDSIAIYQEQNREDLMQVELAELAILQDYLPAAMSEEELRKGVQEIITETGATSMADMRKVMPVAMGRFSDRADGKAISTIIKDILK